VPAATGALVVEENTTDLSGIKSYLLEKSSELTSSSNLLKEASDEYSELAKASGLTTPLYGHQIPAKSAKC